MLKTETHAVEETKRAAIRDGALILYFDTAENPSVARFDLDSLAQASFEIADKRENSYYITLRDFSGQVQDVARFGTKTEAHQALQAILQALLAQREQNVCVPAGSSKKCDGGGFWCLLLRLLKWLALIVGTLVLAYLAILYVLPSPHSGVSSGKISTQNKQPAVTSPLSVMPEGESMDADTVLPPAATPVPPSPAQQQ